MGESSNHPRLELLWWSLRVKHGKTKSKAPVSKGFFFSSNGDGNIIPNRLYRMSISADGAVCDSLYLMEGNFMIINIEYGEDNSGRLQTISCIQYTYILYWQCLCFFPQYSIFIEYTYMLDIIPKPNDQGIVLHDLL